MHKFSRSAHFARLIASLAFFALSGHASLITSYFDQGDGLFTPNVGNWLHSLPGGAWNLTGANGLTNARLTSPVMTATGGTVELQFSHTRNFENAFDGGHVELNATGIFLKVPGSSFTQNGYNSNLINFGEAWSGGVFTPITSIATLGTFNPGDTFRIAFVANFDGSVLMSANAWNIYQVSFSNTELREGFVSEEGIPEPATLFSLGAGLAALYLARRRNC